MKCCGHETENESNKKGKNNKEHAEHSEHSSCCGGRGIVKWLLVVLLVSFFIFFLKGMI